MRSDPRVDAYIDQAAPFAQPILRHLRALWEQAVPDGEEGMKWNMPHLILKGRNIAGMAAFKAHCALILHSEERRGAAMGQFGRIASLNDLPSDEVLISRIRATVDAAVTK